MNFRVIALAGAALLGLTTVASAASLTVNSLGGYWQDATRDVSGEGTNEIRWGNPWQPSINGGEQSGYEYNPTIPPIYAVDDTPFILGQFTHHNRIISNYSDFDVDLVIEFEVVGVDEPITSVFSFEHTETWNDESTCANGGANHSGVNVNGCADRVVATLNEDQSETFVLDGVTYILDILGFQYEGDTLTQFWTTENAENTAELLAVFRVLDTPSEVPLPASGLLLLGGIGGLVMARRRRT